MAKPLERVVAHTASYIDAIHPGKVSSKGPTHALADGTAQPDPVRREAIPNVGGPVTNFTGALVAAVAVGVSRSVIPSGRVTMSSHGWEQRRLLGRWLAAPRFPRRSAVVVGAPAGS